MEVEIIKKILSLILAVGLAFSLCACPKKSAETDLADMRSGTGDGYKTIIWGDKTYVPYSVIARSDLGKQIGIVDGEERYRVYEYKGHSTDEWIIEMLVSGLMDNPMLLRELNTTDIPEGLQSEYEWNNF